jgi:hypothetical protein
MNPEELETSEPAEEMVYPRNDEDDADLSQALAITHEQVSDVYMAGTSDGITFVENGVAGQRPAKGRQGADKTNQ